jgi:hypothetical protein
MRLARSERLMRLGWLCVIGSVLAVLGASLASAQSGPRTPVSRPASAPAIEGRVVALPADNLLITDIRISRLRAAHIFDGEVVDVEVGGSRIRARLVGPSELQRLMTDLAAWAAADVDALCFETDDRTLGITAPGASLGDLVGVAGRRRIVVSKP